MILQFFAMGSRIIFIIALILIIFLEGNVLLNLAILISIYALMKKDLKDESMARYYYLGIILTAAYFISSAVPSLAWTLSFPGKIGLQLPVLALLLVFLFAQLTYLLHTLVKKTKTWIRHRDKKSK